jgi:hypothetical protein
MSKPKFAMYWAASCGGCEIAVLNIHEKILDVDAAFDVVFWPVAMDAKYKDVEAMQDGEITLCLFNGGMRNDENEHIARLLRKKSKIMSPLVHAPAKAASLALPISVPSRIWWIPLSRPSPPITRTTSAR